MRSSRSANLAASALAVALFATFAPLPAGAQSSARGAAGDVHEERGSEAQPNPLLERIRESPLGERLRNSRWLQQVAVLSGHVERMRDRLPEPARARLEALAASGQALWVALGALAALCLLPFALTLLRGRGDLIVALEYPAELRGTFSVRLARRRARFKRAKRTERAPAGRAATATAHYMISRETQFRSVRAGRWYVTVEGVLQDPDNHEVLAEHFEERPATLRRGQTSRREFDFRPKQCPVSVKVFWDQQAVTEAAVVARGMPLSHRYVRDGVAHLSLQKGAHTIVIGSGDRVAELPVEIQSHQPAAFEIDLGDSEHVLFKGCPKAVQLYLQGDVDGTARALEREGQEQVANLLLARIHGESGQASRAAEHFESAGEKIEAAELRASLSEYDRAAVLFEEAGEPLRAAEMYRRGGKLVQAGMAYEAARDLELAIECFRESGDVAKWVAAVERNGEVFEAAKIAMENDSRPTAIRLLQGIPREDPRFPEACDRLIDLYQTEGQLDLAAEKLQERLSAGGDPDEMVKHMAQLAEMWERAEELERAIDALEVLRRSQPSHPNIATRIEALRKKLAQQVNASSGTSSGANAPAEFAREGRYELMEEIGRGGMGVVFKARDRRLSRVIALKRLPDNLRDHPKAVQLFLREAQAAAALNHPNIVTLYDADQEDGNFFITMELLEGFPLNAVLNKRGRLRVRDTARLGVQIATGLEYAHSKRIVHRDVKTANLFFTKEKVVKIMDFGLAKMIEEVRRASTVVGGTPYYMAPEQSLGEAVDHRADLYAFGVTLFELLIGQVPFPEGDVAYHHRHTPPPDPREKVADLPDALAALILRLLEKSPEARPGSAAEVAQVLGTFITPTS
jgi:tRNA A-37 threonylcarbamoyl transferase component Bud32